MGKIYRIAMSKSPTGKIIGYKLVSGTSPSQILKKKSKYVGRGVYIRGVMPTKIRGTLASRRKLSRSKRFGRGYK